MLSTLLQSIRYPNEIAALYKMYTKHKMYHPDKRPLEELAKTQSDHDFCYSTLGKVSRSFAVVIQQLPADLRDAVCLFYLVLRALDSIEDDTTVDIQTRKRLLEHFYEYLEQPGWTLEDVGDKRDYRILLQNFNKVIVCYHQMDPKYQLVISRICREMGQGMILYLDKDVVTKKEYDNYCYYVAGLVGVGLTELFIKSGMESRLSIESDLPVEMGLFLQKTNIIRDYHEDIEEGRTFWPKEIWGAYTSNLEDLKRSKDKNAIHCLNHMIADALSHAGDCLSYLRRIDDQDIFNFCAIPQVMAIATLVELYDNPSVFSKNVKIRKGLAADLIFKATDYQSVESIFVENTNLLFEKVNHDDPGAKQVLHELQNILDSSSKGVKWRTLDGDAISENSRILDSVSRWGIESNS